MSSSQYVLLGDPIDASPSPAMHNAAFSKLGLNAVYDLAPTRPEGVEQALAKLRDGTWAGANVTTPLKTIIAPNVEASQDVSRAGAVNTIALRDGVLKGWLTDVEGILLPLQAAGVPDATNLGTAQTPNALILGAGGACRAAVLALERLGCRIHVAARRKEAAESLLQDIAPEKPGNTYSLDDAGSLAALFPSLQVVIQGTPVGKLGDRHKLPWEASVGSNLVAFDMLYLPEHTPFLEDAQKAGAAIIPGWKMLLAQGAKAFEIWTHEKAPIDVMQDGILAHLRQGRQA